MKVKKRALLELSHEQIKTGGFLPILVAIATGLGALAGGGAAIANSVISAKHQKTEEEEEEEEEETKRHNAEIEKNSSKSKNCKYWCWFKKIRNRAIK